MSSKKIAFKMGKGMKIVPFIPFISNQIPVKPSQFMEDQSTAKIVEQLNSAQSTISKRPEIKSSCQLYSCRCAIDPTLKCELNCACDCCNNDQKITINNLHYGLESVIISILFYDVNLKESIISSALLNGFYVDEIDDMTMVISSYDSKKLFRWALQYEYNLNISVMYGLLYYEPWKVVRLVHHSKINLAYELKNKKKMQKLNNNSSKIGDSLDTITMEDLCKCDDSEDDLNNQTSSVSYYPNQITKIYGFPKPIGNITIGVIGLSGTIDTTEITKYWLNYCKIPQVNHPRIVIIATDKTTLDPNIIGYEQENTMDVELIGGCCANDKYTVTIILYHAENTIQGFYTAFNYAIYDTVYKPTVISCSWGISELIYTNLGVPGINQIKAFDNLFQKATQKGINICCASGDYAASDGINDGLPHVDFPASSPNVVSCGGTKLFSPNGVYDMKTLETVWSYDVTYNIGTGAGISSIFTKPDYQSTVLHNSTKRGVCDLSSNSDPETGYKILFGGQLHIIGGTSCSAPIIASFIASCGINKFINPIIYNNQNAFHKISSGSNGYYSANSDGSYSVCSGLGSISPTLAQVLMTSI